MRLAEMILLETIERFPDALSIEYPQLSGYGKKSCQVALWWLGSRGLVERGWCWGANRLTEHGKIVLAIVRGQAVKQRSQRIAA